MNWTELNALLEFEISETQNCKRVTANYGLPDAKGLYWLKRPWGREE